MALIVVDQEDLNPQQLTDTLHEAERVAAQLTSQANASGNINHQMASDLASVDQRPIA